MLEGRLSHARFINHAVTGKAGSHNEVRISSDVTNGDGTHTVTLSGDVAVDSKPTLSGYRVPQPSRLAEIVFAEALHERGIVATARLVEDKADIAALSSGYTADHAIAEHVSPPYAEEVKITLKVGQNLHASATPFLLAARAPDLVGRQWQVSAPKSVFGRQSAGINPGLCAPRTPRLSVSRRATVQLSAR